MKAKLFQSGIIFLVLMGWAAANAQLSTKTYTDDKIGFTLEYPAEWEKANISGGNIVAMFTGGTFNRNVQVLYDEGSEQDGVAALHKLKAILRTQKEISAEWTEVNGRRAYVQNVEWDNPLGKNHALRLLVPTEGRYFLVMGICPASEYGQLKPLLEKCVFSFEVNSGPLI